MKIHEYQGKAILKEFGVPVPRGIIARSPEEAEKAAIELGTDIVVVKAQIHAAALTPAAGMEGRRRKAREIACRSETDRGRHARNDARHAPDRA